MVSRQTLAYLSLWLGHKSAAPPPDLSNFWRSVTQSLAASSLISKTATSQSSVTIHTDSDPVLSTRSSLKEHRRNPRELVNVTVARRWGNLNPVYSRTT